MKWVWGCVIVHFTDISICLFVSFWQKLRYFWGVLFKNISENLVYSAYAYNLLHFVFAKYAMFNRQTNKPFMLIIWLFEYEHTRTNLFPLFLYLCFDLDYFFLFIFGQKLVEKDFVFYCKIVIAPEVRKVEYNFMGLVGVKVRFRVFFLVKGNVRPSVFPPRPGLYSKKKAKTINSLIKF